MTYKKIVKMLNGLSPKEFMIIDLQTLGKFWANVNNHVDSSISYKWNKLYDLPGIWKPMKASVDFIGLTDLKKSLGKRTENIIFVTNQQRHKGQGIEICYDLT